MNRQFNIELINKLRKSTTGNPFLNGLLKTVLIILYPLLILGSLIFLLVLFLFSIFQRLTSTKVKTEDEESDRQKDKSIEKDWSILAETNQIKLYQQYEGEVRFGHVYLKLKSSPIIETLAGKLFGDWFFCYQNGIFLQQWNSIDTANTSLIFLDTNNFEAKIIRENISSVLWKIVEKENKTLELTCDTGQEILTYKIETIEF